METNTILLIVGGIIVGLIIGFVIAKALEKNNASKLVKNAKKEATSILKEANHEGESIKKDKIIQAKEQFIEHKAEHEKVILSREKKMAQAEQRTSDKQLQITSALHKNTKHNTKPNTTKNNTHKTIQQPQT